MRCSVVARVIESEADNLKTHGFRSTIRPFDWWQTSLGHMGKCARRHLPSSTPVLPRSCQRTHFPFFSRSCHIERVQRPSFHNFCAEKMMCFALTLRALHKMSPVRANFPSFLFLRRRLTKAVSPSTGFPLKCTLGTSTVLCTI